MSTALRIDELVTLPVGAEPGPAARLQSAAVELGPGTTLGSKYVLLRELGKGGVGAVYAAENTWTGRRVAIKVLHVEYANVPQVVSRFWHEARIASSLRHPNIVDVLDMGFDEANNAPFIVEELLDGEGFDALLARAPSRRVSPEEALRHLVPVMDALAACHEAGVIHRDVKPSNILLCRAPDGATVPKLIDFGVSRSLRASRESSAAGLLFGTPHYMSPEQARGEPDIDARTDVWAMGVTLFEALAGRCPFEGGEQLAILAQVQHSAPPRVSEMAPDVPADLAAVIDQALRPARDERPPTMHAFIEALLACEAARGLNATPAKADAAPGPEALPRGAEASPLAGPTVATPGVLAATPTGARPRLHPRHRAAALVLISGILAGLLVLAVASHDRRATAEAGARAAPSSTTAPRALPPPSLPRTQGQPRHAASVIPAAPTPGTPATTTAAGDATSRVAATSPEPRRPSPRARRPAPARVTRHRSTSPRVSSTSATQPYGLFEKP